MSITLELAPSTTLRYTESRAYIKAPANTGYTDSMVGKLGYAQYKINDQRWYFREEGETDWRWVHFNQIAFVPMIGDKIYMFGPGVPDEYRWDRYAVYNDQELRDRVVKVTSTTFELADDAVTGTVTITGEVKSRQKPDDTEQVKVVVQGIGTSLPWKFAEAVLSPEESDCRATRFHEFHTLAQLLFDTNKAKANYQSDIALIGGMLEEEATNRNWCEEYDIFVDSFNDKSKVAYIEPRSNDYDVEVELEFTIRVKHSVYTSARNADEAVDYVRDMSIGDIDFDLHNAISNFDYDVVDEDIHEIGSASEC
jgi:hypothetical protein